MKKRRTIDHDGLDGILQATLQTTEKPTKSKLSWLLPVVLAFAAGFVLLNKTPLSPAPTTSSLQVAEHKSVQPDIDAKPATVASVAAGQAQQTAVEKVNPAQANSTPAPAIANTEPPMATSPVTQTSAPLPTTEPATATISADKSVVTVYFKFDSVKPSGLDKVEKNKLIFLAKQCQHQIGVTGHTCNMGADWSNQKLGFARANALKQILIKNGIPSKRIITSSEGMHKPIAANDTKPSQALNRRTEVYCFDPA